MFFKTFFKFVYLCLLLRLPRYVFEVDRLQIILVVKNIYIYVSQLFISIASFRACLHVGGEPHVGEVTRLGGVTRLSI